MTAEQVKELIHGGEWISIATELRPSKNAAAGTMAPFYLSRVFRYYPGDKYECTVISYADANGKVPLVRFDIKGTNEWVGEHPIAPGAQKVDYIVDGYFNVTPLHQGLVDNINKIPAPGLNPWAVNVMQDIKGKDFKLFEITRDYDLIYVTNDMLFMGSRNVDGQAFDSEAHRPTNLQIPLVRKK